MMVYYQRLKSGGKTQKTSKTTEEIMQLDGKAVELKKHGFFALMSSLKELGVGAWAEY